jgi:hypothetical protein
MKRLTWLINRVRVMSVREVLFRTRRALLQIPERLRVAAGWRPMPAAPVTARLSLFAGNDDLLKHWQMSFRLDTDRLSAYMEGRINFFGHAPLDVGLPVNWQRDPVTGIEAPQVFGKSLNYRDDRLVGNVKFTWELGRHQHLVPLAVAYAVSGDTRYRKAVMEQLEGWIDSNPYAMGIHWCSALELSLRLISWAVVHSLLALRDGEQGLFAHARDARRLGDSIYQQAFFVRHYLSRYSSANNHLIGELSGLFVACTVFDLGTQGEQWAAFSHAELEREAGLQVHSDGVNKEQAAYYHLWVLEYFFFVWLTARRSGQPFSKTFTETILGMARFLEDISPPGGEPPQIGDADDGFVARFSPDWPQQPYREMLSAVHAVFGTGRPDVSDKAFWCRAMLGAQTEELPTFDWQRAYPARYPEGGYVVLGNAAAHLVLDAGPLGYLGIAAHGHADALAFCLALDGRWWLVDPGTYAYHSAPEWRDYFRGTAAHNTVRVNGRDQSLMGGAFMWLEKARARLEECSQVDNIQYVKASHDGYEADGISHVRELRFNTVVDEIEIQDTLSGAQVQGADIFFHLTPEVHLKRGTADNCWIATQDGSRRQLLFYTDPSWEFQVCQGSTDPILGWYSPALEEKIPAPTLWGTARGVAASRCMTRLVIGEYDSQE